METKHCVTSVVTYTCLMSSISAGNQALSAGQGSSNDESNIFAESATATEIGLVGVAIWAVIVTVALGALALVVYRKLKRNTNANDVQSVSSGSGASADLSDFGDPVMGGGGGVNNEAYTIESVDTLPSVHQSGAAANDQSLTVRL